MKRIYFRGGMSPLENFTPGYILTHNVIGSNVGNFLYLQGTLRALTTSEEDILQPNYYNPEYLTPEEINENYDYFIIPLADGFREDFQTEMKRFTRLIKKVNIPCVVTGVGLRAPYEPDFSQPQPFDDTVKEFVSAVLEKSACIGVRGELTAAYLKSLGFIEDKDFMQIGCPSMYMNGGNRRIRPLHLTKESSIALNSNNNSPDAILSSIVKVAKDYPNHYFIGQVVSELRHIYVGSPYGLDIPYPIHEFTDEIYQTGRARFFCNVYTWLDFMRQQDFAFGSRLHGNITATLAGTPSILITKDSRTRELAEFHHLNCITEADVAGDFSLEDLVAKQDFGQIERYHQKNFENFCHFLDRNGLDHIYKKEDPEVAPLDRMIAAANHVQPVVPMSMCTPEEVAARFRDYYENLDWQLNDRKEKLSNLRQEVSELKRIRNSQERTIASQKKRIEGLETRLEAPPVMFTDKVVRKVHKIRTTGHW